ncbi:S-adenosyl-L-methionine-dependent methyltransferase [Hypoxylon rubiginosum]|uniref:S-adenosyl-L-methionine-dependent methyltransferase n=1 Tax=Hypoxylon rubiginosum TaxID=110542 RepID=A0ACB9YQM7_9PEZI|nr:S-adenosyl-L-methionine-dependent methyltransferase [Hypoxylon rubiginosum]
MSLLARTADAIAGLLSPWLFLGVSASCLPRTVLNLLRERRFAVLLSPRALRDAWFGEFWGRIAGPNIRLNAAERVVPLLEGRTAAGRVLLEDEVSACPPVAGVVLEVGAGSGLWVDVFPSFVAEGFGAVSSPEAGTDVRRRGAQRSSSGSKGITRVYGVEPNRDQHPSLRKAIARAGLEDVYRIVPVGIEELDDSSKWDGRVEKGSVDCIVSILCLCSIPDPEKNIRELYRYLKKGGRWYVYEHVRCEYSWYMRLYQRLLNVFWPHFIGGCLLCRQTEKTLREAGPWEKIDVGQPPIEPWYQAVPHILGVFTK